MQKFFHFDIHTKYQQLVGTRIPIPMSSQYQAIQIDQEQKNWTQETYTRDRVQGMKKIINWC